ncbi:MAG: tetratricopeptide repeat protein [Verrucomicrobiota bacterium]
MNLSFFSPRSAARNFCLIALIGFLPSSVVSGADFEGAASVLKKVEKQSASTNAAPDASGDATLRKDLKEFQKTVGSLAPEKAAAGWLELIGRSSKLAEEDQLGSSERLTPISADELIEALPPPKDWAALAKAIFARPIAKEEGVMRETGLRLLATTLTGDTEARKKEIALLQSNAEKADAQTAYLYKSILEQISQAMLAAMDDPDSVIKSLERQLAQNNDRAPAYLRIPNLVSLVGTAKSEEFLRRALLKENSILSIEGANDTSRLAQKLALEMLATLKKPHWELINSLDSVELYEAMEKRFPEDKEKVPAAPPAGLENLPDLSFLPENGRNERGRAQTYYLLGLISKQRPKEAVAVAKKLAKEKDVSLPTEALKQMERTGYTKALDDFFFELLSQDPTLPFWSDYVQLAAKAGKTDRMLTLARATAARGDLSKAKKSVINQTLFRALLAAEQVDEGVKEMRRFIKENAPSRFFGEQTAAQLSLMLARIGMLLNKPDWINEGIEGAKKSLQTPPAKRNAYGLSDDVAPALAELLVELKRGAEAEAILSEALAEAVKNTHSAEINPWDNGGLARNHLVGLARIYYRSSRPHDVLTLLEKAPYWHAKDLADMREDSSSFSMPSIKEIHNGESPLPIVFLAGNALAAVGRKEEARAVANDLLNQQPGLDRGYELLISLGEEQAVSKMNDLFKLDQFEERPLIWKAELLRRANKLEEAEKVVRQAISIDPSDGEQGPDDRMRAYAVLADIREARGDKKEADFFRGAVKAIRLSEKADKFYMAGLLKPAIKMYEESLKLFADAYCIQSRLAIQLSELGLHDEAEAHYRRAYELMPDSFGRVESHCFGCERAFEGKRAQSLAEKVFTDFAKKFPDKPQVHYLLGYLREEQERYAEALPLFQTAVRLDPAYLNAWKKLQELTQHVRLPKPEQNEIAFSILRLDPLSRHVHPSFDSITDLAGLWNAVEAGQKQQPEPATKLLSLEASKAALEKKEAEPKPPEQASQSLYEQIYRGMQHPTPARAVSQTPFVRVAAGLLGANSRYDF